MTVITGVGAACMDYLNKIESYPSEDGSTHILSVEKQGGGACATALCAAVRLGCKGRMIGCVGQDKTGEEIIRSLKKEDVDCSLMQRCDGFSPVSQIMVSKDGERTKFVMNNTLPPVTWNDEKRKMIAESDVVHLDGTRFDNAMAAIRIAEEAHVLISLDGCHMEEDRQKGRDLALHSNILIMNKRYPMMVSGCSTIEQALHFFADQGPQIVISTLGDQGCLAVIDNQILAFPAYRIPAVDTTGAGDVFHGAFLAFWCTSHDAVLSIRYASAAAALKCMHAGGRSGMPDHKAVMQFLTEAQKKKKL